MLVLVTGSLVAATDAAATTINFSSLAVAGSSNTPHNLGTSITVDGFTFSHDAGGCTICLAVWETDSVYHPTGGAETTSLFEYLAFSITTITKDGGGTFELNGIDLAQWGPFDSGGPFPPSFPPTFDVLFTGTKSDSTTVTQTFTVTNNQTVLGKPFLQSFVFSGFVDLQSVSMKQGVYIDSAPPGPGTAFQFNNLVVNASLDNPPASVPEPASLLLLSTGLIGAGVRRYRQHSK
jgi:hypothetical protein